MLREIAAGVVLGFALTLTLVSIQVGAVEESANPFTPSTMPSHPLVEYLADGLHATQPCISDAPSDDALTSATLEMPPGVGDHRNTNHDQNK